MATTDPLGSVQLAVAGLHGRGRHQPPAIPVPPGLEQAEDACDSGRPTGLASSGCNQAGSRPPPPPNPTASDQPSAA